MLEQPELDRLSETDNPIKLAEDVLGLMGDVLEVKYDGVSVEPVEDEGKQLGRKIIELTHGLLRVFVDLTEDPKEAASGLLITPRIENDMYFIGALYQILNEDLKAAEDVGARDSLVLSFEQSAREEEVKRRLSIEGLAAWHFLAKNVNDSFRILANYIIISILDEKEYLISDSLRIFMRFFPTNAGTREVLLQGQALVELAQIFDTMLAHEMADPIKCESVIRAFIKCIPAEVFVTAVSMPANFLDEDEGDDGDAALGIIRKRFRQALLIVIQSWDDPALRDEEIRRLLRFRLLEAPSVLDDLTARGGDPGSQLRYETAPAYWPLKPPAVGEEPTDVSEDVAGKLHLPDNMGEAWKGEVDWVSSLLKYGMLGAYSVIEYFVGEYNVLKLSLEGNGIIFVSREGYKRIAIEPDAFLDESEEYLNLTGNPEGLLTPYKKNSDFTYSYIYIRKYRTIKEIKVCFDHRYDLSVDMGADGSIAKVSIKASGQQIPSGYFYGRAIASLTCLVGKNGEGKTSIIDFLRSSFYMIKEDIDTRNLEICDGVVIISEDRKTYYHLGPETEFLAIFSVGGQDYCITNIGAAIERPGSLTVYSFSYFLRSRDRDRKIVYISMQTLPEGVAESEGLFWGSEVITPQGDSSSYEGTGRSGWLESNCNIHISEEVMNYFRRKLGVNMSLFCQLFFLCGVGSKGVKSLLDLPDDTDIYDRFKIAGEYVELTLFDGPPAMRLKEMESADFVRALNDSLSYLWPFSSGQYSRFTMLSRLYFCVMGEHLISSYTTKRDAEIYPAESVLQMIKEGRIVSWGYDDVDDIHFATEFLEACLSNGFFVQALNSGACIKETDTAVILFDEADTYYHPDWQKDFLKDCLDIINKRSGLNQVVFGTNSPFILSDILREDVVTLKDGVATEPETQTFGQNIHKMLIHRFFMNSTVGSFSDQRIRKVINILEDPQPAIVLYRSHRLGRKLVWKDGKMNIAVSPGFNKDTFMAGQAYIQTIADLEMVSPEMVRKVKFLEDWKVFEKKDKGFIPNTEKYQKAEEEYVRIEIKKEFGKYAENALNSQSLDDFIMSFIRKVGEPVIMNELRLQFESYQERVGHCHD